MENPAVAVVVDFDRGIDAEFDLVRFLGSVFSGDVEGDILAWLNAVAEAGDVVSLSAVEIERFGADTLEELKR